MKNKLVLLAAGIAAMTLFSCGQSESPSSQSSSSITTLPSSATTASTSSSSSATTVSTSSSSSATTVSTSSPKSLQLDLVNAVANIQDANSLSIKKRAARPKGLWKNAPDTGEQTLVKRFIEFADDGTVIDENNEISVSFKKITTTVKTSELNGQDTYIPFEDGKRNETLNIGSVKFSAEEKHAYNLYDENNVCLAFDVIDNGELDLDPNVGAIKIEVPETEKEYRLASFEIFIDIEDGKYSYIDCFTAVAQQNEGENPTYSISFSRYLTTASFYEVYDSCDKLVASGHIGGEYGSDVKVSELPKAGDYTVKIYEGSSASAPAEVGQLPSELYAKEVETPDYAVSFEANEGFNYRLCDTSGNILLDEITDNCEADAEAKEGRIKIKGLNKEQTYIVKYHGFGEETEITQESIGAVIDKAYVHSSQFTFISFVPEGESKRPADKDLTIDSDGVATYDKTDYYSDNMRQSFLLNNYTGLVYKLDGFRIDRIEKRVLYPYINKSSMGPCGFRINENDELEIFQIVRNATITYSDIFGDKYNQYYVVAHNFTGIDQNNKTIYFKNNKYTYTQEGNVLHIEYYGSFYDSHWGFITSVTRVGDFFDEVKIQDDETIKINTKFSSDWAGGGLTNIIATEIRGGYLYFVSNQSWVHVYYVRVKVNQPKSANQSEEIRKNYETSVYLSDVGDMWSSSTQWPVMITDNIVLLYSDLIIGEDGKSNYGTKIKADHFNLYFAYVWEIENPETGAITVASAKDTPGETGRIDPSLYLSRVLLLENCVSDGEGWYNVECSFDAYKNITARQITFDGTTTYKVVMDKGYPEVVNVATYVAPETTPIIIQPINRN